MSDNEHDIREDERRRAVERVLPVLPSTYRWLTYHKQIIDAIMRGDDNTKE